MSSVVIAGDTSGSITLQAPAVAGTTSLNLPTNSGGTIVSTDSSLNIVQTAVAGLGYGTGAGGTVTQATSKTTTVTLNKPCGQIITHSAALAAGATVQFGVNNTSISTSDTVLVTVNAGNTNAGSYRTFAYPANTIYYIQLVNIGAVSLSEAVSLNFAIIKGANS